MLKQKLLPLIGTALLLFGCKGNNDISWTVINEKQALEIQKHIVDNVKIPDYVSMSKKYSRIETYGGSTKRYEYEGPRLEISKNDFYIKNVLFQPDDWKPEEGEKPYYVVFTEYHVIKGTDVWLLKDKGGVRSKTSTHFPTVEKAQERMLFYMNNDITFTLKVDFLYDLTIVDKLIELSKKYPDDYKAEMTFKNKEKDDMSLSCEYSYSQPGNTEAVDALRAHVLREWENGYETYEQGHYEGIDYDAVGFKYDYMEDAEYKAEYNKAITIDPVDPDTWCE